MSTASLLAKGYKIELRNPQELIPYELNAKKHEPEQIARICKAIQKSGWDVPIVVDKHGVIIKGHGRRMAAIELGMDKVPVLVRDDLTPDQVKAARLADNRVAEGDLDMDLLRASLREIDMDLGGIFDDKELSFLDADLGTMNDEVFREDMASTLSEQRADIDERADRARNARVPVAKAFGFKDLPGTGQRLISKLMARAEATTNLAGADALLAYLDKELA